MAGPTLGAHDIDLYSILQVSPRAKREVIEAAFKALIQLNHPDKGGNEVVAGLLNDAHKILGNPDERAKYDKARGELSNTAVGNYRILEPIAEGGFGRTYKAEHLMTKEPVCIKQCGKVTPEYEGILIEEAKIMWDLRHYSMPAVRDLIRLPDESLGLVMSYVPGPTLEQIVQKVGCLEAEHVAWITERVLNALKYMHYHGVVHGDVKPQNIIVQPKTHTVVVVDFGLAKLKPVVGTPSKGYTPYYSAPEEISGRTILPESDFYSLGKTIVYALTGDIEHVKDKNKGVPASVPDEFVAFIQRLIKDKIHERPHWPEKEGQEDLCDTISQVRRKAFGRSRSGMKPIPGVDY